jgi:DMSO/TMAO reductase YedYZ heme-binding membrane subunit
MLDVLRRCLYEVYIIVIQNWQILVKLLNNKFHENLFSNLCLTFCFLVSSPMAHIIPAQQNTTE